MANYNFFDKKTDINFTVKNIDPGHRLIHIFNSPIPYLGTKDLLSISEISESDIRESLIKGELSYKIRAGVIEIVSGDINLIQFNDQQHEFVENAGVKLGGSILSAAANIHLNANFPLEGGTTYDVNLINNHHVNFDGYDIISNFLIFNLTLNFTLPHNKRISHYSIYLKNPISNIDLLSPFAPVATEMDSDDNQTIIGTPLNTQIIAPGSPSVFIGITYSMFEIP